MHAHIDGENHKVTAGDLVDKSISTSGDHNPQKQFTDIKTKTKIVNQPISRFTAALISITIMVTAISCCHILRGVFTNHQLPYQTEATTPIFSSSPSLDLNILTNAKFDVVQHPDGSKQLFIYHNGKVLRVDSTGSTQVFVAPDQKKKVS